ncbi:uncharacterized protein Z519_01108 [Cladophialophora bantiana CBS 173.52]|uniref:Hypervirulence associated protein TUDOR domain-containing protein n=1 Tax=Cladophialophora bantiana (strain ATCC 10958 / CBS 173.52 / CDC B-1940 / NIH 8579) TaxID=1442370 RepID=A0A0D2IL81_CLAB1|nr:uncharacterized protein Z519_01108 [Cladophialophora bantiana CBS 173.52]KIW97524.1 hypothetical protein Z519_01108 [Cladophialophora bantiana CBS 173.52]
MSGEGVEQGDKGTTETHSAPFPSSSNCAQAGATVACSARITRLLHYKTLTSLVAVTWNWGGGQPGGTVAEKKTEGEVAITSKRGNKVKKNAEPENPAVRVERSGQDVVKKASELNVEEKANGDAGSAESDDKKEESKQEAESTNGEKRKHDEVGEDEKEEENKQADEVEEEKNNGPLEENAEDKTVKAKEPATKKQKKEPTGKAGRPKKAEKKEEEEKEKEAAATEEKEEEENAAKKEEPKSAAETKKKAGRPKKADGAPAKQKKQPTPRATEGIGSRTRSQQKSA